MSLIFTPTASGITGTPVMEFLFTGRRQHRLDLMGDIIL